MSQRPLEPISAPAPLTFQVERVAAVDVVGLGFLQEVLERTHRSAVLVALALQQGSTYPLLYFDVSSLPKVADWLKRIAARPAYGKVMARRSQ